MPTVWVHHSSNRSASFLGIWLSGSNDVDTIRHERGHGIQHGILGTVRYGLTAGISSPPALGPWYDMKTGVGDYYAAPWETMADIFGGVQLRNHSNEVKIRAWLYTAVSFISPPLSYLFLLWK